MWIAQREGVSRVITGRDTDNPRHGTQSSYGPGSGIPKLSAQQSLFFWCLFWNGRYNRYQTGEGFNMAKGKTAAHPFKPDDKPKTLLANLPLQHKTI